jgi:predicted  nucleic acid-binding Zn-ribbon protein
MIDVMKKLQEIAEAGYDNEDIQRGIDAAGKHVFKKKSEPIIEGDIPPGLKAYQDKQNKKKGDKPKADEAVEEAVKAVDEDLVDEADDKEVEHTHEDGTKHAHENGDAEHTHDDDIQEVHEDEIDEAVVEVPVNELAELMQLAGYTDYAEKIEEYANEPDPEYMDAEEQLVGLSGGLNGPKKAYAAAAGGDNAMAQEPQQVRESSFDSFYAKYDKFVKELSQED